MWGLKTILQQVLSYTTFWSFRFWSFEISDGLSGLAQLILQLILILRTLPAFWEATLSISEYQSSINQVSIKYQSSISLVAANRIAGWIFGLKVEQSVLLGIQLIQVACQILTRAIKNFSKLRQFGNRRYSRGKQNDSTQEEAHSSL